MCRPVLVNLWLGEHLLLHHTHTHIYTHTHIRLSTPLTRGTDEGSKVKMTLSQEYDAVDIRLLPNANRTQYCEHGYIPTVDQYMQAMGRYSPAVHAVGSIITIALFVFYVEHIIFTYRNTHTVYRRHINWLACFYPLGALMTILALVVPRAHNICTAVKIVFFALGISHFTDLTVVMFGCEKGMLAKLKESKFVLHVGLLRCCVCIPSPAISKIRLRFLKWMIWQFPYSQTLYFFFEIYWTSSESDPEGLILLNYDYLWLDIFNALSFFSAIYAFTVLAHLVRDHLHAFNYKRKYATLLLLLIVLKLLGLVITILGNYEVFPCLPPYINSRVYSHTVLNLVHLVLLTIFGGLEYWQYHTEEFLSPISDKHHQHHHELIIHGQACVCIISEMTGHQSRRKSIAQLPFVVEETTSEVQDLESEEKGKTNPTLHAPSVEVNGTSHVAQDAKDVNTEENGASQTCF